MNLSEAYGHMCTTTGQTYEAFRVIRDHANRAEAEVARLRAERRWIPVEERLPEDNEWVLGADRCWRGHPYRAWLYHHALRDLFVYEFSHWMPLPEPPEGGEG